MRALGISAAVLALLVLAATAIIVEVHLETNAACKAAGYLGMETVGDVFHCVKVGPDGVKVYAPLEGIVDDGS